MSIPTEHTFEIISSVKTTHFTDALIQDAAEEENFAFNADWGTAQMQKQQITNISILSDQNLDWELQFYSTDAQSSTDEDTDTFITSFLFAIADGKQNAATGLYRYDANPAFLPFYYHDADNTGEYHLTLVNRSATAKTAGAAGSVVVRISARPVH